MVLFSISRMQKSDLLDIALLLTGASQTANRTRPKHLQVVK